MSWTCPVLTALQSFRVGYSVQLMANTLVVVGFVRLACRVGDAGNGIWTV